MRLFELHEVRLRGFTPRAARVCDKRCTPYPQPSSISFRAGRVIPLGMPRPCVCYPHPRREPTVACRNPNPMKEEKNDEALCMAISCISFVRKTDIIQASELVQMKNLYTDAAQVI